MFRLIAQDITSGEFLDWDLPVSDVQITDTLSGPSRITGRITPEVAELVGRLQPWGTWVHVEEAGQIRGSGILQPFQVTDQALTLEAEGVAGYPHGIAYLGEFSEVNVDPADVVREIWRHVQSYPGGDLGVTVSDTRTPVRVGTEVGHDDTIRPYELAWWQNRDCGAEIDALARSTPFDYRERVAWNSARTDVVHEVELGYPRLGRRRPDLRFAEDENVTAVVPVEETPDEYASDVLVVGAGEGRDAIRGAASDPIPGRVRRVATIVDKGVTSARVAKSLARDELRRRQAALLAVREVVVDAHHEYAPFGSYQVGDDILVQASVPWLGDLALWHRIIAYTYAPDVGQVRLQLRRSEMFRYGRADTFRPDAWYMDDPIQSRIDYTTIVS